GGNRRKYCGGVSNSISNTELICEEKIPKITINDVKYRILDWDDTTQKLTVAREDYSSGNVCAVNDNFKNSTFDNSLFQHYNNDVSNVTLLYNCDATANPQNPSLGSVDCGDSKIVVYTVVSAASGICTPSVIVVIPISVSRAGQLFTGNGIEEALKDGFDLKWTGNYGQCQGCIGSG
ncbi:ser/thr protein kinase, partial [Trifolium medium]|nr:ser/thr protein kinase [Trifolium medium]